MTEILAFFDSIAIPGRLDEALRDEPGASNVMMKSGTEGGSVKSLTPDEYNQEFPEDYKIAISEDRYRGEPAVNFAMINRARTFQAMKVRKAPDTPRDIVECFNRIADAAVQRSNPSTLGDLLDSSLDQAFLGKFSANIAKARIPHRSFSARCC